MDRMGREAMGKRPFRERENGSPLGWQAVFSIPCSVMQENTTKIRNIKQYLKAVLFNAPSTIDSYYTSLVAHDMASGALAPRKPKYGDPDYYTYNEGESL